jgi:hypothetical protein
MFKGEAIRYRPTYTSGQERRNWRLFNHLSFSNVVDILQLEPKCLHNLDPKVYAKGRGVTVGGSVVGSVRQPLGDREYTYPVIEAQELHLWPIPSVRPGYPYYYDPWYDNYWYGGSPYLWHRRHYPWGGWPPWYP